jgi:hypothetical protein
MTIRTEISNKKRKTIIILFSGIAFMIIGTYLTGVENTFPLIPFLGFVAAMIFYFFSIFHWIRCPICKNRWGVFAMWDGGFFTISKKIKHCPYCGISIDSEITKSVV